MPKANGAIKRKSGDSMLADAALARERNRKEIEPSVEELPEMLQDVPEKKRAEGDYEGAMRAVEQLTKLVEALQGQVKTLSEAPAQLMKAMPRMMPCGVCRQALRTICSGEHVVTVVMPSDINLWASFSGVTWNGVVYKGRCLLPKVIEQDILSQIRRWEANEREKFMPGGKIFESIRLGTSDNGSLGAEII